MATSEILTRSKQYSAEIHDRTRAQQLKWFGEEFSLPSEVLLQLVGYKPAEIKKHLAKGRSIEALAEKKPEGTIWVTELFRELAFRGGYDMASIAKSFRESPPGDSPSPFRPLPPARKPAASRMRRELLRRIGSGGPRVYTDLTNYLRLANGVQIPTSTVEA